MPGTLVGKDNNMLLFSGAGASLCALCVELQNILSWK